MGSGPRANAALALVVVLAGISEALGHSVVLFINRVRPRRFGAALLSSALLFVLNYLFWALSVYLLLRYALAVEPTPQWGQVLRLVALAYTPRLLAFLVFTPLLGPSIGVLLSIWSLLILQTGVESRYALTALQALGATGGGWLLTQLTRRTLGYPLVALARSLTRRAAGSDLELRPETLYTTLRPELERYTEPEERR